MIKRSITCFIAFLFAAFFVAGCAGRQYAPKQGVMYYHSELPAADRAVETARAAGKDKECPVEFAAAEKMKKDAYDTYLACHTAEGIAQANKAAAMANALCSRKAAVPATAKKTLAAPQAVAAVEKNVQVVVLGEVYFANDSFALTADAKETLKKNAKVIGENPNVKVRLEGHASAIGTKTHNMKLSGDRVNAVKNYLVSIGVSAERLSTVALGEGSPIVKEKKPVTKESSAAKANRVVIEVIVK